MKAKQHLEQSMQRGAIDRIRVEGFKSLRSMELKLRALNLLIGPNGVGKSNFVSLFRLLNQLIEKRLQVYIAAAGSAEALLHFGRKTTEKISIEIAFSDMINGYSCTLEPTDQGSLFFAEESVWFHEKLKYPSLFQQYLGAGHLETRLLNAEAGKVAKYVIEAMRSWRIYHFHDTSAEAKVKQPGDLHDNRTLRGDAANLAAFLFKIRENFPTHYRNIVDAVRMVAPFFDDFILEPLELNTGKIRLEWREKGEDTPFGPEALSDGTLRFICLATLLLQPYLPTTILLDEPELGLHPYAITLLAELLRGAATKTQVIASTQSVSLVNQFEPNDAIVVERDKGQSVFRHLDATGMQDWLEDYGLGDLWEKNLLGGRP
jgi:predicted ATPase